jgi:hypothetical protein
MSSIDVSGIVQIQPDGAGKAIDASVVTTDAAAVVYRQRINVADPIADNHAGVGSTPAMDEDALYVRDLNGPQRGDPIIVTQDLDSNGPLIVAQGEGLWREIAQARDPNGAIRDLNCDPLGNLQISNTVSDLYRFSFSASGQTSQAIPLNGATQLILSYVSGAGNIAVDASLDGVSWVACDLFSFAAVAPSGTSFGTATHYRVCVSGFVYARIRASTFTTLIQGVVRVTSGIGYIPVNTGFSLTAAAAATTTSAVAVALSPNTPVPTMSQINSAATTNATSIKASAGTIYNVIASNAGAAAVYVKFYNLAAAPTVGTSVPVFIISLGAAGTADATKVLDFGLIGQRFTTGIALAITNLPADSDTTVIAAAQVKVSTSYI